MSWQLLGIFLGSYLVGSVPSGFLLARLKGIDVRSSGSGNIGATNVARTAGSGLGGLTLLIDVAKGALPVLVVGLLGYEAGAGAGAEEAARIAAALGAVVGHVYPITLGFRGGKGVATALGAILGLAPLAVPIPLVGFAVIFGLARRVSLASIGAAVLVPLASAFAGYPEPVTLALAAMTVLIILRHRENIGRLLAGTEPRFGRSPDSTRR